MTFEIEDQQPLVKLTVIHETDPDSLTLQMISNGWPWVLAGLKSLLETGHSPTEDAPATS